MTAHEANTGTRVVFLEKGQVATEPFEISQPGEGQIAVRSLLSLMSTGTENIVLNGLYAPGTHWDNWVKFPFYPGYSTIGVVTGNAGSDGAGVGELVALRRPHASHHVVATNDYVPVPKEIDIRHAVWFALAKIAFHGARASQVSLGASTMVIGAGPIGQMALRWLAAAGAGKITIVDPAADRLELAMKGGATDTIAEPIDAVAGRFAGDKAGRPEIVIDTTGNAKVFAGALAIAKDFGRVVVLGDTGFPGQQVLTSDVIGRGLTVVGAHDGHNDAQWNNYTISSLFFDLVKRGRFPLDGMISHQFSGGNAPEGYTLVNTRRTETMGVAFKWSD